MGRLAPLVASLALLVGAACSGGDDPGPTATVPTAVTSPSSSPTSAVAATVPTDSFAIPEVIDADYVNRVLAALYAVDGDVVRAVVATGRAELEDIEKYAAIYAEPQLTIELDELRELSMADLGNVRIPPGNRRVTALTLVTTTRECIVAEVKLDYSAILIDPPVQPLDQIDIIGLIPTRTGADERGLNPTPWAIVDTEILKTGEKPEAPCG